MYICVEYAICNHYLIAATRQCCTSDVLMGDVCNVQVGALPDSSHQAMLASSLQLAGSGHEAMGPLLLPDQLLHLLPQPLLTALMPAPRSYQNLV